MVDPTPLQPVDRVATCTLDAVHRRDHDHDTRGGACHPHLVEVVHLGRRAVVVCHDCQRDSGFVPERDADRIASAHRQETTGDGDALFSSPAA